MLFSLALKNIQTQKIRSFLTASTIFICSLSLIIFLSFLNGLDQASKNTIENQIPLNQITAFKSAEQTGVLSLLATSPTIEQKTIDQIRELPGVEDIYLETQFPNFSSLSANIAGFTIKTDAMLFGLPAEKLNISAQEWQISEEPYPAIVPRKFLDLYNLAIARPQNLPTFKEENIINKTLTISPGKSILFPNANQTSQNYKVKIIGFSDQTSLIGLTLPPEFIQKLNQDILQSDQELVSQIHIKTTSEDIVPQVASEIEQLGLSTSYLQKNLAKVQSQFLYLQIALTAISIIILLITLIAIANIFLGQINERQKEIGIMRALGASKNQIKKIILLEGLTLSTIAITLSSLISLPLAKYLNQIIKTEFSAITVSQNPLFLIQWPTIISTTIFTLTLTFLSIYIPAQKASKLSPLDSLRN